MLTYRLITASSNALQADWNTKVITQATLGKHRQKYVVIGSREKKRTMISKREEGTENKLQQTGCYEERVKS